MNTQPPFYIRLTISLLLLSLLVVFLILSRDFLVPFTIAIFFSFVLLPVSTKLEMWKVPRVVAILISIIIALLFFVVLGYFFISQIANFQQDWPILQKTLITKWDTLQNNISETFKISKSAQKEWITSKIEEHANKGGVIVLGIFSATTSFVASFTLIPIYIFFLMLYKDKFKTFIQLIAKENKEQALLVARKISTVSQKYLVGIFLDVLILSVLNSVGFLIVGLPHAILFGVLASVLNIIPYIGILIGSVLPILMAFLTMDYISSTIAVACICIAVQFLDNNFITPNVVGSSVSINPLAATIALIVSSLIWGIPGMILCLPLAGMLKVACDNIESLKPYGYLLGEEANYQEVKKENESIFKQLFGKRKATE